MLAVQEFRKLFSERLIAFGFVPRNNSAFKQQLLAIAGQLAPRFDHGVSEGKGEAIFVHIASMQPNRGSSRGVANIDRGLCHLTRSNFARAATLPSATYHRPRAPRFSTITLTTHEPKRTRREFRILRLRMRIRFFIDSCLMNYYRRLMTEALPLRAELETKLARLNPDTREGE